MPDYPSLRGDHLFVRRPAGYLHHGIDIGDGWVIHYSGEPGSAKRCAAIVRTRRADFGGTGQVRVRLYGAAQHDAEVRVARAESRLGETGYNLAFANCEHFATWCATGRFSSRQVNGVAAGLGTCTNVGFAATAATGVVAASGTVTGVSGAGVMSGLAATGRLVHGGAVEGLYVLGAAPAALAAGIVHVALKDSPQLPQPERIARAAGRQAPLVAGTTVAAAGVQLVEALGTPGLSAAGISSGLAAIGEIARGGGMVRGVGVLAVAPALAVSVASFGTYHAVRAWQRRADPGPGERAALPEPTRVPDLLPTSEEIPPPATIEAVRLADRADLVALVTSQLFADGDFVAGSSQRESRLRAS